MYIFIDESGDPGFKIARGSSPIFVTSMVIFRDANHARAAQTAIADLQREVGAFPEFKFNKATAGHRDRFFEAMAGQQFSVRAVVVKKELIYSEALRTVKESFYKFFIRQLMEKDGGILEDARVVIDGSGD